MKEKFFWRSMQSCPKNQDVLVAFHDPGRPASEWNLGIGSTNCVIITKFYDYEGAAANSKNCLAWMPIPDFPTSEEIEEMKNGIF